ncbi:MAG: hypothetical protein HS099_18190 [Ardenticatenaceae bacterium]|nr:hypothetical protein [Ardenticatenaceae bacterium]
MKKFNLHSLILMTLLALGTILLATVVAMVRANDNVTFQSTNQPQFPQEVQWFEWDGTTLVSRTGSVFSTTEQEFIMEWNRKNSEQATLWQLYQSGALAETPEKDVTETGYGIVTVEKASTEGTPLVPGQEEIDVEIEHVETPYGIITVEKHSFRESTASGKSDSGANLLGLSQYMDALYQSCGSNGVEFNFASNNTQSNYELHWSGGSHAHYVSCASSCTFKITTSWSAYYTWARAYTTSPGYVYGFGFDDYRCR